MQVKEHKLINGNVMDGIADLMGTDKASIFYSDPPWGQGNLNYWQTINKRHNGIERKETDYNAFLNQIFDLAKKHTNGMVFIEYGIKWEKDIISIGEQHGLKHLGVATIKYKSGSKWLPHQLHIFTTADKSLPEGYLKSLDGTTGMDCLTKAVKPFYVEGGIILDPCCGLGMTSRLAVKLKMNFRGNELNPKRLQTTIDWLNKNA